MRNRFFNALKENWYFIRQDIVSYLLSTALYIVLWLITDFCWEHLVYSIFECLVFYLPFWYIRICFSRTYHSDSWKFCKFCTRSMLCLGVFLMWILPINYSLFNCLLVALVCCVVLYWIALETDKKKLFKSQNLKLQIELDKAVTKLETYNNLDLHKMTETELRQFGASRQLSEIQQDILVMRIIEHLKISEICRYRNYGRTTIKYHISEIKRKLELAQL